MDIDNETETEYVHNSQFVKNEICIEDWAGQIKQMKDDSGLCIRKMFDILVKESAFLQSCSKMRDFDIIRNPRCLIGVIHDVHNYSPFYPLSQHVINLAISEINNRGVVSDEGTSLIEGEYIKAFLERKEWTPDEYNSVKHVLITCDPNTSNSKTSSEMSLVATAHIYGMRVVSTFYIFILFFVFFVAVAVVVRIVYHHGRRHFLHMILLLRRKIHFLQIPFAYKYAHHD